MAQSVDFIIYSSRLWSDAAILRDSPSDDK